jgi:hypothetical protein
MTAADTQSGGAGERDRFIPVRKTDILDALIGHGRLRDAEAQRFRLLARLLGAIYHYDYFDRLETLRNDYFYFNPDLPHDLTVDPAVLARAHDEMVETLVGVLREADFAEVAPEDLARSHRERHALKVEIAVEAEDYREVRFFRRGHHRTTVETAEWFGLRKRQVEIDVYDHLVLMVMVKPADEIRSPRLARRLAKSRLRPGTILIKHFRDVARSDLSMLFPDVRVVLGPFDMFTLGVPALAGGIPIILKLLPTLSVLFAVAAAYLGFAGTVQDDDMKKALAALSGLVALGGFLTRQWLKYQRESLKYHKEIADNVYFRNITNNSGVLETIIGAAEEQECKEAFLAYYFLATAAGPIAQRELEMRIEQWLRETFAVSLTFDIGAALAKLERLGLLRREDETLAVPPLDAALQVLDRAWADFFPAANAPRSA